MGALFINGREHRRAITLLCSTVQADTRLEPGPLWCSNKLMFAAEAVTDSVTEMWQFLLGLYPKLTWLSHFFVNDRVYIEGIRAYRAVASLIELGKELASGRDLITSKTVFPSVAPVSTRGDHSQLRHKVTDRRGGPGNIFVDRPASNIGQSCPAFLRAVHRSTLYGTPWAMFPG